MINFLAQCALTDVGMPVEMNFQTKAKYRHKSEKNEKKNTRAHKQRTEEITLFLTFVFFHSLLVISHFLFTFYEAKHIFFCSFSFFSSLSNSPSTDVATISKFPPTLYYPAKCFLVGLP